MNRRGLEFLVKVPRATTLSLPHCYGVAPLPCTGAWGKRTSKRALVILYNPVKLLLSLYNRRQSIAESNSKSLVILYNSIVPPEHLISP